jgi:hypothetical protein
MADDIIPPGLVEESRRTVTNIDIKDEFRFDKYSCETNGEYTE